MKRFPKAGYYTRSSLSNFDACGDVNIMWNILVAIYQDDLVLVESDSSYMTAIGGTPVISDNIWM